VAELPLFNRHDPKNSLDQNDVNNMRKGQIALIAQQLQGISQLVESSVDKLTDNPNSPETHQYQDYIKSLIREGFTGNLMSPFNALLKDLSVKPLDQGSVQRLSVCRHLLRQFVLVPLYHQLVSPVLVHALFLVLLLVLHLAKNLRIKICLIHRVLGNAKDLIETMFWIDLNVCIQ
jgi:hypothetical protein